MRMREGRGRLEEESRPPFWGPYRCRGKKKWQPHPKSVAREEDERGIDPQLIGHSGQSDCFYFYFLTRGLNTRFFPRFEIENPTLPFIFSQFLH